LTAEEVRENRAAGYAPWDYYHADPDLREAVDLINSGHFSHGDANLFKSLKFESTMYDSMTDDINVAWLDDDLRFSLVRFDFAGDANDFPSVSGCS
jgi:hypothetical protein